MSDKRKDTNNTTRSSAPIPQRKSVERDGVIYTPSSHPSSAEPQKKSGSGSGKPAPNTTPKKAPVRKQKHRAQFATFFIIVVFLGVLVCVVAFAVAFNSLMSTANNNTSPTVPPVATSQPISTESYNNYDESYGNYGESINTTGKLTTITAVIMSMHSDGKKAELYDVEQGKTYMFYVESTTELKDKYGKAMVFAEFTEGDIVEVSFENTGNTLKTLKISPEAFTKKSITGVKVDTHENQLTIGNDAYNYNYKLICSYKGASFDIADLDTIDTVTVKGYKNNIWYVGITQGHGTVKVAKQDTIISALLEIDTSVYRAIDSDIEFKLPEGNHKAIIKGKNINPYIKEFTLSHRQTYELDLTELTYTAGLLTITVAPEDSTVKINGDIKNISQQLYLNFGKYTITAESEGYIPSEQEIEFREPAMEVSFALELNPEPTPSPTPEPTPEPTPSPTPEPTPTPTEKVDLGTLTIITTPEGADVYIDDNKYVGKTPVEISAEYGRHTITIQKDGYVPLQYYVIIAEKNDPNIIPLQPEDTLTTEEPSPGLPITE